MKKIEKNALNVAVAHLIRLINRNKIMIFFSLRDTYLRTWTFVGFCVLYQKCRTFFKKMILWDFFHWLKIMIFHLIYWSKKMYFIKSIYLSKISYFFSIDLPIEIKYLKTKNMFVLARQFVTIMICLQL